MDNKLDELMEQFMEGMNVKKAIEAFLQSFQGKHALVSRQMLIELGGRVDAAKSEEEKKRIIERFLKDVVKGEITLYHWKKVAPLNLRWPMVRVDYSASVRKQ